MPREGTALLKTDVMFLGKELVAPLELRFGWRGCYTPCKHVRCDENSLLSQNFLIFPETKTHP